ncbi:MAG: 4Fe-4S ferredoxin [Firmicutes bacterium]|nr:4Fe-4S ferredoxin [Bacillota bacterium]
MNEITSKMQQIARELLGKNEVQVILGWEKGAFWFQSSPVAVRKIEEVGKLVWDEFGIQNLANFLLDYRDSDEKIGIFVKGCDSRAVNRLLQDNQFPRERLYVIGVPCGGKKDPQEAGSGKYTEAAQVPLAPKCQTCAYPNPVIYDALLGEPVASRPAADRFKAVTELENMTPDERYDFWAKQFEKCLRCYACRNVCVCCSCRECIFEQTRPQWVGRETSLAENQMYHLIRALHVAGRCVECGECERVCPVGIPLMLLNEKIIKDINELFGPYDAGVSLEAKPPFGFFKTSDPEEFM